MENVDGAESSQADSEAFISNKHAVGGFQKMQELYKQNLLTDVTLCVGGVKFSTHRIVLASVSDYFYAMFTSNLREASAEFIPLPNVDLQAFQSLIEFCYTGKIELSVDTIETLLLTACMLQISEVKDACCAFMIARLNSNNCIGMSVFAEANGCMELHLAAQEYILSNFIQVYENQEYLSLPPEEVKKLLSSDMLNIRNEEIAFHAMLQWINHDINSRKEHAACLLEVVKLPLLSVEFLADSVSHHSLFHGDTQCYALITEAMRYHIQPERRFSFSSPRTRPRKSTVGNVLAIGMNGDKDSTQIEKYDFLTNTWSKFGYITTKRLQFGVALVGEKLYVIGGRDGLRTLNTVECYDFNTKTWSRMSSMLTHRHGLGVGVFSGPLYVVGGHDGWTYLNTVERWDADSNQWSYVAPLNVPRSTAGVAVLNEKMYAVGGRDGSSCLCSVECYDPFYNKWTFCAPMPLKRAGAGVGVANGYLFVLGGHDAPSLQPGTSRFDTVGRYDPKTDSWTSVAPLSVGRDSLGVCALGNYLIAVGGYDGHSYLSIVELYDPETNEWKKLAPLPYGKAPVCLVVKKF